MKVRYFLIIVSIIISIQINCMNQNELPKNVVEALFAQDFKTFQDYLDKGGNINGTFHEVPLIFIAINRSTNDLTAIKFLLEKGININFFSDRFKRTPLEHAIRIKKIEAVQMLLKHGADVNMLFDLKSFFILKKVNCSALLMYH